MLLIAIIRNFGGELRTRFPTLDLIVVIATLTLPQLTALPAQALGWDPLDSADPFSYGRTISLLLLLSGISIALGVAWGRRKWLVSAAIFCLIFIPLYTTFFTNPYGIFTGFVRSLGYWLVQQGVERGSQPWYYYLLLQIPMYEYLAALRRGFGCHDRGPTATMETRGYRSLTPNDRRCRVPGCAALVRPVPHLLGDRARSSSIPTLASACPG